MSYKTVQEEFWAGEFGSEYMKRNTNHTPNINFFSNILMKTAGVNSIIEFGSNIGLNLKAIQCIMPEIELSAVEINNEAVHQLKTIQNLKVYHTSILDFKVDYQRDFVLSKGVLIHINPEYLNDVYEVLYHASKNYICIAEYYNPTPVEVNYRGYTERLYKRDFAGDMLEKYKDLELIDYGFVYHRDNNFPQDDITWFLLKKSNR